MQRAITSTCSLSAAVGLVERQPAVEVAVVVVRCNGSKDIPSRVTGVSPSLLVLGEQVEVQVRALLSSWMERSSSWPGEVLLAVAREAVGLAQRSRAGSRARMVETVAAVVLLAVAVITGPAEVVVPEDTPGTAATEEITMVME
jgi:hypothetical protein